jgi:hypothetical protein
METFRGSRKEEVVEVEDSLNRFSQPDRESSTTMGPQAFIAD